MKWCCVKIECYSQKIFYFTHLNLCFRWVDRYWMATFLSWRIFVNMQVSLNYNENIFIIYAILGRRWLKYFSIRIFWKKPEDYIIVSFVHSLVSSFSQIIIHSLNTHWYLNKLPLKTVELLQALREAFFVWFFVSKSLWKIRSLEENILYGIKKNHNTEKLVSKNHFLWNETKRWPTNSC